MEQISNTKQLIFNASLELFAQKGFNSTSIRDIAEKVGIKTASMYYHYTSKEEILNEIFDFYEKRSLFYYEELNEFNVDEIPAEEYHKKMHIDYKPEEMLFMYWAGRIVINEHFWNPKAADLLLGSTYETYIQSYEKFLHAIAEKGLLDGEKSRSYAEILVMVSMVFLMQFQHPEIYDAKEVWQRMDMLYKLIFDLFLKKMPPT